MLRHFVGRRLTSRLERCESGWCGPLVVFCCVRVVGKQEGRVLFACFAGVWCKQLTGLVCGHSNMGPVAVLGSRQPAEMVAVGLDAVVGVG